MKGNYVDLTLVSGHPDLQVLGVIGLGFGDVMNVHQALSL